MKTMSEHTYHLLFRIGIIVKAAATVFELAGGAVLWFTANTALNGAILFLTGDELIEHGLFRAVTPEAQHLWALLLLGHGVVKLFLVIGLLKERLWSYPSSAAVFTMFVIYQIYETLVAPSLFIDALTAFDIVLILLILHEYRYRLRHRLVPMGALKDPHGDA